MNKRKTGRRWLSGLVTVLVGLAGLTCATPALAVNPACTIDKIQLIVPHARDAEDVCLGVARAVTFFAGHGLTLQQPVELQVSDKLPAGASSTAAGIFLAEKSQVVMLTYGAFRKFGNWFSQPIGRELYQSLAAHEISHAIVRTHFKPEKPSVHAQEYLAYVALFANMPAGLRDKVLQAFPSQGLVDENRLSLMVYLMDPMFFGAQSYRHYLHLAPAERSAFFAAVLAGQALSD